MTKARGSSQVRTIAHKDHTILIPPPTLRDRAMSFDAEGGAEFDLSPLAAGERALAELAERFEAWMAQTVERLEEARRHLHDDEESAEAAEDFYRAAHDLRGQGATFGHPVAGEIADGLCDLLDVLPVLDMPARALIDAHVMAVRAVVRENVRDRRDETTDQLLGELRAAREAFGTPKAAD